MILAFCLAVLAGIAIAKLNVSLHISWLFMVAILCIVTFKKKNFVTFMTLVCLGLAVGLWRGGQFLIEADDYQEIYGKKIVLVGEAKSDGVYDKKSQLSFDLGDITLLEPEQQELVGKISASGFGEPAIYRGDIIQLEGKIYPLRGAKQARMSFAQVKVVARSDAKVEEIRKDFIAGMYSAVPEPQASFGLGLLVGLRSTLPENVSESLKMVGLTHIVAVSGYNLTILVRAAQRFFGKRSKYQGAITAITLILLFLAVTGLSASIVRAAFVSGLGLTAWYFGRQFRPTLLIAFTAALTALWSPLYVWSDIGWYLSFLAFYGVLVLAPLITKRLWANREELGGMKQIVLESICAQIMTLPLILYIFSETSLVSLIANVLVVPLVPFAMLFSAIAGTAGMLIADVSGWLSWPATILLTYMLDIAAILSTIPNAQVSISLDLAGLIILYGMLAFVSYVMYHKIRGRRGILKLKNNEVL